MRLVYVLCAFFLVMPSAYAGQIKVESNKVYWYPLKCKEPEAPQEPLPTDKKLSSRQLKDFQSSYSKFSEDIQSYSECLTDESKKDAQDFGNAIKEEAKELNKRVLAYKDKIDTALALKPSGEE